MFSAYCERCGGEVLLSTRRITALDHTPSGILVRYRCWEGHPGRWVTGRRPVQESRDLPEAVSA